MPKLTFDEALQAINDDRCISRTDVRADALRRYVWLYDSHFPGCLSESRGIARTKRDAIESCLDLADDGENGPARGMRTALDRFGNFSTPNELIIYSIERVTLRDIL